METGKQSADFNSIRGPTKDFHHYHLLPVEHNTFPMNTPIGVPVSISMGGIGPGTLLSPLPYYQVRPHVQ
jgi:hypothetical protein